MSQISFILYLLPYVLRMVDSWQIMLIGDTGGGNEGKDG